MSKEQKSKRTRIDLYNLIKDRKNIFNKNNMETKYVRVPFEVELAKKITNGEIGGRIVTKRGDDVRIVCFDVKGKAPILGLIDKEDREGFQGYDERGKIPAYEYNELELMLEIPEYMTFKNYDFKPFDKVLGRECETDRWRADLFSHMNEEGEFICIGYVWEQCIPYNEQTAHLLGTTESYE